VDDLEILAVILAVILAAKAGKAGKSRKCQKGNIRGRIEVVPAMGVEPIRYKPVDFESTDDSLKTTPKSAFCQDFVRFFV